MVRRGIDESLIIERAERMIDDLGSSEITMTALAAELGVRGPSLYAHVQSIEAVLGKVQVRAMRALGQDLQRAAMGRSGEEGLRSMAAVFRDFARSRPGTYRLAMGRPIDEPSIVAASTPAGEALAAIIGSFGVGEIETDLVFACVSMLHGVLDLDRAGLFRASTSLNVDAAWDRAVDACVQILVREAALVPSA